MRTARFTLPNGTIVEFFASAELAENDNYLKTAFEKMEQQNAANVRQWKCNAATKQRHQAKQRRQQRLRRKAAKRQNRG